MKSVYSAVRTGSLNKAVCASSLKGSTACTGESVKNEMKVESCNSELRSGSVSTVHTNVQIQHRHPVLTNRQKQYVADTSKTYFRTDTEKAVKIVEGSSSHAVDSDKYAPGDSTGSTSISVFTKWRAQDTNTTAVRPTREMQATAYVTSSGRNLLWPMLLQLLMDVPRAHQEFQNKDGMKFSNFDE